MGLGNTIEFAHVTLGLVPEILDTIDMIMAVGKEPGMVDPEVMEIGYIQHIRPLPAARIDDAIRDYLSFDKWPQSG